MPSNGYATQYWSNSAYLASTAFIYKKLWLGKTGVDAAVQYKSNQIQSEPCKSNGSAIVQKPSQEPDNCGCGSQPSTSVFDNNTFHFHGSYSDSICDWSSPTRRHPRGKMATWFPSRDAGRVILVEPVPDAEWVRHICSSPERCHPTAVQFFGMSNEEIVRHYTERNVEVSEAVLRECLSYVPRHFHWSGADLFPALDEEGRKKMLVLEVNSRPHNMNSPPLQGTPISSYRLTLDLLLHLARLNRDNKGGDIAVIYDTLDTAGRFAQFTAGEAGGKYKVWYVHCPPPPAAIDAYVKWEGGVLFIREPDEEGGGSWHPMVACIRWLGEMPWLRIPLRTKTVVLNDILTDLAGGRNKSLAAIAYAQFNEELTNLGSGLQIIYPKTVANVRQAGVKAAVANLGGYAAVKASHVQHGLGVYLIQGNEDPMLAQFHTDQHLNDNFIVQELVAPAHFWHGRAGSPSSKWTLLGTKPPVPGGDVFTFSIRFCVISTDEGIRPLHAFAKTAVAPQGTLPTPEGPVDLWDILGTNVAKVVDADGSMKRSRPVLRFDEQDFEQMQLSLDDLIEAFVQTTLATIAVDKMAVRLLKEDGEFNRELFYELHTDEKLLAEIIQ